MTDDPLDLSELDAFRHAATPRVQTAAVVHLLRALAERIRTGASDPAFVADLLEGAAEGLQENALEALAGHNPTDPEETP